MTFTVRAFYKPGEPPVIVRSAEEMDGLVDALLLEPFDNSIAALYVQERPLNEAGLPDHELRVGVNAKEGTGGLRYIGGDADATSYSKGVESVNDEVYYCYMGNDSDFPRDSVISIEDVKRAARDFLERGGLRPHINEWQPKA